MRRIVGEESKNKQLRGGCSKVTIEDRGSQVDKREEWHPRERTTEWELAVQVIGEIQKERPVMEMGWLLLVLWMG